MCISCFYTYTVYTVCMLIYVMFMGPKMSLVYSFFFGCSWLFCMSRLSAHSADPVSSIVVWSQLASFKSQLKMCAWCNQRGFLHVSFSRMRSEGSRFTWGSGGEAVFAKSCVCDRNRRQPSASVRNRLRYRRKALHSGECVWSGPESVSS